MIYHQVMVVGDLLDLLGDSAFEIVQDLGDSAFEIVQDLGTVRLSVTKLDVLYFLQHRKDLVDSIRYGLFVIKSDKTASNAQLPMPSYGTQVTIQIETEKQIDKLHCTEEKKSKRGAEHGDDNELSSMTFSSLLEGSKKKMFLVMSLGMVRLLSKCQ